MELRKIANIATIFIAISILIFILERFASVLKPLFIGIILSFLLVPVTRFSGIKKFFSFILGIILLLFLISFTSFVVISIDEQSSNVAKQFESKQNSENFLLFGHEFSVKEIFPKDNISEYITTSLKIVLTSIVSFLSELFLIILIFLFLVTGHDRIIQHFCSFIKTRRQKEVLDLFFKFEKETGSYLFVKTAVSFGTALLSLFVMILFGVQNAFIYSVLIFFLNYIPNIGSIFAVLIVLFGFF